MNNSKNKIIAAAVCGVIIGSVGTAVFGDFDVKKDIEIARDEEKEKIEITESNDKSNKNNQEVKANENIEKEEVKDENDNSYQEEGQNDLVSDNIVSENEDLVSESDLHNDININTNVNINNSNENNNSSVTGSETNVQSPPKDVVPDTDIKDEPIVEIPIPEPSLTYYDGTYIATSTGYDSGLQVKVNIYLDKIAMVTVVSHNETIGICDKAIELIPYRITASQSTNVDIVSGATYTSNGIINAVNDALSQARR